MTLSAAALLAAAAVPPAAAGRGLTEQELWSTRGGANGLCCGSSTRCQSFGLPPDGSPPECPNGNGCAGTWGEKVGNGQTCVEGRANDHCENENSLVACLLKTTCTLINGVCQPINAGSDSVAPCQEFALYCSPKPKP